MAANSVTSSTGTVAGDLSYVLFKLDNIKEGVNLYVKYTIGTSTSFTLAPRVIVETLSSTDEFPTVFLSADSITLNAQTYTKNAAGNFRIPISIAIGETYLKVYTTITGGADAVLNLNIVRQ